MLAISSDKRKKRRRRKVWYYVCDAGKGSNIWFVRGRGLVQNPESGERSTHKLCRTKRQAYRWCLAINELGGCGVIAQMTWYRGRRRSCDSWIHGFKPESC